MFRNKFLFFCFFVIVYIYYIEDLKIYYKLTLKLLQENSEKEVKAIINEIIDKIEENS